MNKINKGTGAGGTNTNKNGINFEQKTYLGDWIIAKGYILKSIGNENQKTKLFKIYFNNSLIGYYGQQGRIYEALKIHFPTKMNNKYIKKVLSKKINPDAFIINIKTKDLIIFEKKWQQGPGSVDEKIQTGPFKLQIFEKLTRNIKLFVSYQYILSKWFKQESYRNVKEYYKVSTKINIWVEEENLNKFNIAKYLKTKAKKRK